MEYVWSDRGIEVTGRAVDMRIGSERERERESKKVRVVSYQLREVAAMPSLYT